MDRFLHFVWFLRSIVLCDHHARPIGQAEKQAYQHGIGMDKKAYLADLLGPQPIALMQGIKQVFDPKGILNPGKVFNS